VVAGQKTERTVSQAQQHSFEARDDYGNFDANLRFLDAAAVLKPGRRLLEIGTGKGRMLRELQRLGLDARGIENNPWMVEESRRLHGELPVTLVTGHTLPFPDASFDVVVSFDVFEHIAESDAHLREVRRVLVPGGRYLLQTPNKWTNSVFETIRWRSFTAWRKDHCALHSYRQAQRRFAKNGFEIRFHDVPVVTEFFKRKVRRYMGAPGVIALKVVNPDKLPMPLRTNFYIEAFRPT
jgi:ubiquinone/menaquinone biosynthesis C-methylase UbiE